MLIKLNDTSFGDFLFILCLFVLTRNQPTYDLLICSVQTYIKFYLFLLIYEIPTVIDSKY